MREGELRLAAGGSPSARRVDAASAAAGLVGAATALRAAAGRAPTGTTASDTSGAAAMPSATTDWPRAMPTVTASANMQREIASINTSPP